MIQAIEYTAMFIIWFVVGTTLLATSDKDEIFLNWIDNDKTGVFFILWIILWPVTLIIHWIYYAVRK